SSRWRTCCLWCASRRACLPRPKTCSPSSASSRRRARASTSARRRRTKNNRTHVSLTLSVGAAGACHCTGRPCNIGARNTREFMKWLRAVGRRVVKKEQRREAQQASGAQADDGAGRARHLRGAHPRLRLRQLEPPPEWITTRRGLVSPRRT